MGARQYSPELGRFLEADPIEGGSANDYEYAMGDPVDQSDYTGLWCMLGKNPDGSCRGSNAWEGVRRATGWASRAYRAIANAPASFAAISYTALRGGKCYPRAGFMFECMVSHPGRYQYITIGSVVLNRGRLRMSTPTLYHESRHADQWATIGPTFGFWYLLAYGAWEVGTGRGECNIFEWWAGFKSGGYSQCDY